MKKCIINYASGSWYPAGQLRLQQSLAETKFDGDVIVWRDEKAISPITPRHCECPYGFKPHALLWAARNGYDQVIWADASVWAIRNIQPMFDHITKHGWMLFYNCCTGNWTSDACLKGFGITRDEAMSIHMLMGICMGWDLNNATCLKFLDLWLAKASDGFSFPGSWTNQRHEVSADPRVSGHRHDQSVASILAHQLGMNLIVPHETFFQYYENPTKNTFMENPDFSMIRPHTVMVAQGM